MKTIRMLSFLCVFPFLGCQTGVVGNTGGEDTALGQEDGKQVSEEPAGTDQQDGFEEAGDSGIWDGGDRVLGDEEATVSDDVDGGDLGADSDDADGADGACSGDGFCCDGTVINGECIPNDCPSQDCPDLYGCAENACVELACIGVNCSEGQLCEGGGCVYQVPVLLLRYFPVVECYGPISKINALPANASANEGNPSGAFDGNQTEGKWQPMDPFPEDFIQIDLTQPTQVKAIAVYFYWNDRPEQFHIEVSDTGAFLGEQQTVVTELNGLQYYANGMKSYVFPAVETRYIRLVVDAFRANDPAGIGSQVNLYEMEIFADYLTKNCLDGVMTGIEGVGNDPMLEDPLSLLRASIATTTTGTMDTLVQGSKFRGYTNPASKPSFRYVIFEEREYLKPFAVIPGEGSRPADYQKILKEEGFDICDYVENRGVKEVWAWLYQSNYANMSAESFQTGPYGAFGNGYMNLPPCAKTYTVYGYNYGRGLGEALEDHTHHMERVFEPVDFYKWWREFTGGFYEDPKYCASLPQGCTYPDGTPFLRSQNDACPLHCGWTHCPPNVILADCKPDGELWPSGNKCQCLGYNWYSEQTVLSDCENWVADGSGQQTEVNCLTWMDAYIVPGRVVIPGRACPDDGGVAFKVWWMQQIPSAWWVFIGDYDRARAQGMGLE